MLPQTDLNKIKAKAKLFLTFDLQPVENFPFIVKHPFTDSNYTLDQSTGTLVNLLEDDADFREKEFEERQRREILLFLYNRFLYDNGKNNSPEWTLCQIYDKRFQFDHKGPLHNYPLDNTIYMLGGSDTDLNGEPKMDNEHAGTIVKNMENWMQEVYPNYEKAERFCEVGNAEPTQLKVRIIRFPSPLSNSEKLAAKEAELAAKEAELAAKEAELATENAEATQLIDIIWGKIAELTTKKDIIETEIETITDRILENLPYQPEDARAIVRLIIERIFKRLKAIGQNDIGMQDANEAILTRKLEIDVGGDRL